MTNRRKRTRAVTREITIAAPVDAVWKALTDAEELTRWFPPHARVEPGAGGKLWRAWQSGEEIEERIERWEPNAHLRTIGLTGAWAGIVTDYDLTSVAGSTTLRVVSSGFGDDADWDDLYDAFGGGWDFELRGLRHYLEHHAGVPRVVVLVRGPRAMTAIESWTRIVGDDCWLRIGPLEPKPGVVASRCDDELPRYAGSIAGGTQIGGVVHLWRPPHQLAVTVEQLGNAYLRVDTRCIGDAGTPWIWLSTYGIAPDAVRQLEREWQASLDTAFATHPV